jgi:hypothetical protein
MAWTSRQFLEKALPLPYHHVISAIAAMPHLRAALGAADLQFDCKFCDLALERFNLRLSLIAGAMLLQTIANVKLVTFESERCWCESGGNPQAMLPTGIPSRSDATSRSCKD